MVVVVVVMGGGSISMKGMNLWEEASGGDVTVRETNRERSEEAIVQKMQVNKCICIFDMH